MGFDLIRMPFDRSRMSFDRASYLIRPPRQNTDLSDWVRCYLNTVIHYWNLIFRVNGTYWKESWKMDGSTPRSRGVLFARRTTILRKVLLKRIKKPSRGEWEFLSNNNNYVAEDFRFSRPQGPYKLTWLAQCFSSPVVARPRIQNILQIYFQFQKTKFNLIKF